LPKVWGKIREEERARRVKSSVHVASKVCAPLKPCTAKRLLPTANEETCWGRKASNDSSWDEPALDCSIEYCYSTTYFIVARVV